MLAATCEEQAVSYQQEVFSFAELKTVINEIRKAVRHLLVFCSSASNRIIGAKDHASIQINIAEVK